MAVLCLLGSGRLSAQDAPLKALDAQWNQSLEGLAGRCMSLNRAELAARSRGWKSRRGGRSTWLALPPEDERVALNDDVERFWWGRLTKLRKTRAAELFDYAQQIALTKPALAYQLCHEALLLAPDHPQLRAVLGYEKTEQGWRRQGMTASSTPQRANSRVGIGAHQRIRTPHFEVLSEAGAAEGARLAREVEMVYAAWNQLFFSIWSNGETLQRRLQATQPVIAPLRRHRVILFKDRERYLNALRRKEPRIDVSVGLYLPGDRTSYFYWDAAAPPIRTWRHEVTHQLFAEVKRAAPNAGLRRNFWLLEGIAMYMESTAAVGPYCAVGGPGVDRLQFARLRRAPNEDSLTPMLVMGRGEMQRSQSLSELYSNAAGITCFLMDGADGKHRHAAIELLNLVYQGRDDDDSLFRLVNQDAAQLITEYHRFLSDVSDNDMHEFREARNICLRGTSVTGAGLARLDVAKLQWLDVAGLPLDDQDLAALHHAKDLRQLNVEATHVTDALFGSASARRWPKLMELDLSQTQVSDDTVKQLTSMPLQVLWLTKTQVTPSSLPYLAKMDQLTLLDLVGLGFSEAQAQKIKTALPNLEHFDH